jgi:uncharacterized protein
VNRRRATRTFIAAATATLLVSGCAARPDVYTAAQPAACLLDHMAIGTVQGAGTSTPFAGRTVTVQGVVVADFEGAPPALGGFYLQDLRGDGDVRTSDGIFVANASRDDVAAGQLVRVTGVAGEMREQTQVVAESIVVCGTARIEPTVITLPFPSVTYLERYEGMLVRVPQTLHVTELYLLGRFNELVLSAEARLPQPTNVAMPGTQALAVQARNDLNRLVLDDASYAQNPAVLFGRSGSPLTADNTLRGGDTVRDLAGVLTRTSAGVSGAVTYRLRAVEPAPAFAAANPRPLHPPAVGGSLRVASFNLLNYFNTFAGCTGGVGGAEMQCRGARDEDEFRRQWQKTVAAILGLDVDILGIVEIENDGYGPGSAIADLVARLNAATTPGQYAFIDADAATGTVDALGTDGIKVGFLYRPDRVQPVGTTAVLNSVRFVYGGETGPRNRPSLAQAFQHPAGGRVVVSINHLKSKGSPCDVPDPGDGQANCNAARTFAARELRNWLAGDPTRTGEANVLIVGDLNAYALEDPVQTLVRAGYTDLIAARHGTSSYSYVFNGQWGYLDHALASASLLPHVTGAAKWHINADEPPVLEYTTSFRTAEQLITLYRPDPFRSSDHDPVLVGLDLPPRR